ncbi:hypothetical protein L6452_41241 [Arctium lappa]|uniref:Uncharacterized protein n=1 Tax=Arctium lappa TaxID=4217 RepID=A0ACB8XNN0_ARCLA|nr:hypothetical protein L6452_41241 [Arctium lappa]
MVKRRLVLPDRTSSEYVSAVGLGDIRRTLDSKIKHDDPRYTSALAVMAAKSAYENPAYIKDTVEKHWKMEFLGFFNCWNDYEEDYTTQGFMWSDKTGDSELIGVSFRGTSPFNTKDWSSDIDLSWYHLPTIGKVHAGFLKALGLQKSKGWPKDIHANEQKLYAYYAMKKKLKVLPEEPNKNYFSIFAIIPMFVNAVWELLRSFIIYYQDGPDYCETFSCRGLRLVGLLIAGLPAHGPQDYVNLTRLGSPELFKYSSLDHSTNGVK